MAYGAVVVPYCLAAKMTMSLARLLWKLIAFFCVLVASKSACLGHSSRSFLFQQPQISNSFEEAMLDCIQQPSGPVLVAVWKLV